RLIESAYSRLKTGAPLLLETVNIASAFGFLEIYTKDLTHRTPVHPQTLRFLLAATGFRDPQIVYGAPVPAVVQLKMLSHPEDSAQQAFNDNMQKLNKLLFDSQEYAAIAWK